jgi:hypothetical protein
MSTKKTPLGGRPISRKEAFKGLGDPKTWAKESNAVYAEFRAKPKINPVIGSLVHTTVQNVKRVSHERTAQEVKPVYASRHMRDLTRGLRRERIDKVHLPRQEYEKLFKRKFARVEREIQTLRNLAMLKSGRWIFKNHQYSRQELMKFLNHNKIHSYCEKISDDVAQWFGEGQLPVEAQEAYRRERGRVARSLHALGEEIAKRKPTPLEKFRAAFEGFTSMVLKAIPTLAFLLKLTMLNNRKLLPMPKRKSS